MPRPSLVSLDRDCIPVVDSYRAKLQKKAEKVLSVTIPRELELLDVVLRNDMMQRSYHEKVRAFTVETVSHYEEMLDEIAEANQAKQAQLEAALGLLLGGMTGKPPVSEEPNGEGTSETSSGTNETSETSYGTNDTSDTTVGTNETNSDKVDSNISMDSVDSTAKVSIGKKRRRGSLKKKDSLKLENKDSNVSLDIKVSNTSEGQEEEVILDAPTIGINQPNHELSTMLKPLILNLYDTVILLRNWISLLIPKIEDGNTFGVEVQENMLVQLRQCEIYMLMLIEEQGAYHLERATLISKLATNGEIRDYYQYILEGDERHCRKLQDGARLVRSQYNNVYRSITQNYDKITAPRGYNKNNMLIY